MSNDNSTVTISDILNEQSLVRRGPNIHYLITARRSDNSVLAVAQADIAAPFIESMSTPDLGEFLAKAGNVFERELTLESSGDATSKD